ncbi:MAG: hypothetical protein ACIAXF_01965 [Phycisphaerales bacterium JB063]
MTLGTQLLLLALLVIAYLLVTAVFRVLGSWSEQAISRHDLIVESRRRRAEYYDAIADRRGMLNETVEVLE